MREKDLLKAIFVRNLVKGKTSRRELSKMMDVPQRDLAARLHSLEEEGLAESGGSGVRLTPKGRRRLKVVFIGGTFEVIHAGHLYTIEEAKKLGDILVVVVARDSTVRKRKNREPIAPEEERVKVAGAIRQVDAAILGSETNIYDTLERVKPDIVALGYDQYHAEAEIIAEARRRGMGLKAVRLDSPIPTLKTSKILANFS
jgi:cytidyltransferase-like protein